jgi:hypothetical protein
MGTYLSALQAAGTSVQNWGKNTQWAGRQITAGFTMPLVLAAAGLASLANKADEAWTRVLRRSTTPQSSKIEDAAGPSGCDGAGADRAPRTVLRECNKHGEGVRREP